VKVAAGKINAVSGESWTGNLQRKPQNYVVVPDQPWLDGFAVGKGRIRQFVAMPLGSGHSVEEQLTGAAENGGIQLQVYPMRAEPYVGERMADLPPVTWEEILPRLLARHLNLELRHLFARSFSCGTRPLGRAEMGLGAGGLMRQEVYRDRHGFKAWDRTQTKRCFVHLCNSMVWREITGSNPPHPPLTAAEYKKAGIPWFDYYRDDQKALKGSKRLAGVKSVAELGKEKKAQPFLEDTSITPELIVQYGNTRRPGEIREYSENHDPSY